MAVHELRASDGDGKAQKTKALRLLARKLVDRAMEGDVTAMKEIGDRLDGRPAQAVGVEVGVAITKIERTIVDAVLIGEDSCGSGF
jgi:hypothetical protein